MKVRVKSRQALIKIFGTKEPWNVAHGNFNFNSSMIKLAGKVLEARCAPDGYYQIGSLSGSGDVWFWQSRYIEEYLDINMKEIDI